MSIFGAEFVEQWIEELLLGTLAELWKKSGELVSVLWDLMVQPWLNSPSGSPLVIGRM